MDRPTEDAEESFLNQSSKTRGASKHARPSVHAVPAPRSRSSRTVLITAIAVGSIVLFCCAFSTCARFLAGSGSGSSQPEYTSPYNWNCLSSANGRYSYIVDGVSRSKTGIDVSSNQQAIDWPSVAGNGVDFAFIRLGYRGTTEGGIYLDDFYTQNIAEAEAAGVSCGVYFFSQATTEDEAREEADFVIANLAGAKLAYPVAFDSETVSGQAGRTDGLDKSSMTAIANAFCSEIAKAGYSTTVYGNTQDMARYDISALSSNNIWYAAYDQLPTARFDFSIWQYSNSGSVAGISTPVDMDIDLSGAL